MRFFVLIICMLYFPYCSAAENVSKEIIDNAKVTSNVVVSGVASALANADLAITKSMICPNHLKGDFAEAISSKFYLEQHLKKQGAWQTVSARFGRQGIDQIYVKYDAFGRPRDIICAEVKYGSSKLGSTKDGIQMGKQWLDKRLVALGERYIEAGSTKEIKFNPSIGQHRHQIEVELKSGRKVAFWRENKNQAWNFDGNSKELHEAQNKVKNTGNYLNAAGKNIIRVRTRIFEIKPKGDSLVVTIKDASKLNQGISQNELEGKSFRVNLNGKTLDTALVRELVKQIKAKFPHYSASECEAYAKEIVKQGKNIQGVFSGNSSFADTVLRSSVRAGLYGAGLTIFLEGVQQVLNGRYEPGKLLKMGGLSLAAISLGTAAGQTTTANLVRSRVAHSLVSGVATRIGVSSSFLSNGIGSFVGGGVTTIAFAYGGYLLGYYDANVANALITTGLVSSAGGVFATTALMSIGAMCGTAGTGVAISSLSGIAATNSTLAWLGGGTVASGGLGIAGGAWFLGGVAVLTAVSISTIIGYYYNAQDNERQEMLLEEFKKGDCFKKSMLEY